MQQAYGQAVGYSHSFGERPPFLITIADVAGAFKSAKRKEVEAVLDSLAALGLLLGYNEGGTRRWRSAARAP
ncbi:MAG: hypothetical protein EXR72_02005 [Myxococcales bacterium]|nr:hypothetical protein [Myxococcales bacterium]